MIKKITFTHYNSSYETKKNKKKQKHQQHNLAKAAEGRRQPKKNNASTQASII